MSGPAAGDTAARRWGAAITAWALPDRVLAAAPASPWRHDVARFAVDDTLDRDTISARWAREVLPPTGGTVLDVGCGGGRSALPLVPPASELIGVDEIGAMLDEFVAAASRVGVARRTVHGSWPEVAPMAPVADVAVCHHVLYNVADVVPFVVALTAHARLAVVVEVPLRHPMTAWNEAFAHFWGIERPTGPTHLDLIAVLRELGLDPEVAVGPRRPVSRATARRENLVASALRRLCLPSDRAAEVDAWLAAHPPGFGTDVSTIRWAGTGEAGDGPGA